MNFVQNLSQIRFEYVNYLKLYLPESRLSTDNVIFPASTTAGSSSELSLCASVAESATNRWLDCGGKDPSK